jgi:hypothetical protein
MITSLSKILMYTPNIRLRINSVEYTYSELGLAEVDATAIDDEGGDLFHIQIPVSQHQVSTMLKEIEEVNKRPSPSPRRRNVK